MNNVCRVYGRRRLRCLRGRHHCGRQSADGGAGFMGELGSWWYNWKELEDGAGERGLVWKPCLWRSVPGCALKPSFLSVHFLQHTFHPLYHRPQKPVLLYTNRNGRFSSLPPGGTFEIQYSLYCSVIFASILFCEGVLLCEVGGSLMVWLKQLNLKLEALHEWHLIRISSVLLGNSHNCSLSLPICKTGVKPPFFSLGH